MKLKFPMKLPSVANMRDHWGRTHRRKKEQRQQIAWELKAAMLNQGLRKPSLPVAVHLTRIAPRSLDEGDNLAMAFKTVRDEIADWLGVDDGSKWVDFVYHQRKGKPKEQACEIRFEELKDGR